VPGHRSLTGVAARADVALDFRSGNEDPYPSFVQDINFAVRWAKLNARALKTRAELVGLSGQSSGGHLARSAAGAGGPASKFRRTCNLHACGLGVACREPRPQQSSAAA
jgi:BD-FAE